MNKQLTELRRRLAEVSDLQMTANLLHWDQATYMPTGGAEARGRQMATLARLTQEKATSKAIGRLLDALHPYEESLPYDSDDASLLRVARRDYERAIRLPPKFVAAFHAHTARTYQSWTAARPANDFAAVRPLLERTLDLSRELAGHYPGYAHIADPLIEQVDYGMTVATIRPLFAQLREQLVPLVRTITAQAAADDGFLHQRYPEAEQWQFAEDVVRRIGYDFSRGRIDKTHHPFMTRFSLGDVRITTRVRENILAEAVFSNIHEAGHAMYEQGIDRAFEATPLARGTSSSVHESQSRTWENIVGRSVEFWQFFYPRLQATFPEQLRDVGLERFHRAINKVGRSLIRTDADEVTYNLHAMLRFDLELQLLEGTLEVRDLPEAWQARYAADLGVTAPDDRDGVLQDVHWYSGPIGGAFHCYTLGNILSAQFYAAALRAHPSIPAETGEGRFDTLRGWLTQYVYRHGRKFTAGELVERATGSALTLGPYLDYLRTKYGRLYAL